VIVISVDYICTFFLNPIRLVVRIIPYFVFTCSNIEKQGWEGPFAQFVIVTVDGGSFYIIS